MTKWFQLTANVQAVSVAAMEEASRFGHRMVDVEHVFLSLVLDDTQAGRTLRAMGITLQDAREAVAHVHREQLAALGIDAEIPQQSPNFHTSGGYDFTPRANRAFGAGEKEQYPTAVLRALLTQDDGMIDQVLHHLGTDATAVLARLDEAGGTSSPDPSESERTPHALAGTLGTFVPAPLADVWAMLDDPLRLPEWWPLFGQVEYAGEGAPRPGQSWIAIAATTGPDGKPIRVGPKLRRQQVELLTRREGVELCWRFTSPDAPEANSRVLGVALEPAAGGTRCTLRMAWERTTPARGRAWWPVRALLYPNHRFMVWNQLTQLTQSISLAFR